MKIGIIGGGLFGRIIGKHLHEIGHEVVIVDAQHPDSGLRAAGCLMKPSWMTKVPDLDECLGLLDSLWGLETVRFSIVNKHIAQEDLFVLPKWKLMSSTNPLVRLGVADIQPRHSGGIRITKWGQWRIPKDSDVPESTMVECDHVLECAGAWSAYATTKYGMAAYVRGTLEENVVRPWRPFTQLVKFNLPRDPAKKGAAPEQADDWIWAGDGSAYNEWSADRYWQIHDRVSKFLGPKYGARLRDNGDEDFLSHCVIGRRPYVIKDHKDGNPCQIISITNRYTVVTGGAKNGTIGAAWAAIQLGRKFG